MGVTIACEHVPAGICSISPYELMIYIMDFVLQTCFNAANKMFVGGSGALLLLMLTHSIRCQMQRMRYRLIEISNANIPMC
jgi:hypothetical protein